MFQVGDWVRLIPDSYIHLAKGGFNQRHTWSLRGDNDDAHLILGGKYQIRSIHFSGKNKWHSLLENNKAGHVLENIIRPDNDVPSCQFIVGDTVIFRPQCSDQDIRYLTLALKKCYGLSQVGRVFEIKAVLNDYYIFLDYSQSDGCAYPLRWLDFKLANED